MLQVPRRNLHTGRNFLVDSDEGSSNRLQWNCCYREQPVSDDVWWWCLATELR